MDAATIVNVLGFPALFVASPRLYDGVADDLVDINAVSDLTCLFVVQMPIDVDLWIAAVIADERLSHPSRVPRC